MHAESAPRRSADIPPQMVAIRRSVSVPVASMPPRLDRTSIHEHHVANARHRGSLDRSSVSAALSGSYISRMSLADPVTQSFR